MVRREEPLRDARWCCLFGKPGVLTCCPATAHLQVFGDLFNAMIDPETEKKKRTPAHMPGFAVAAANPDLAVKMVLRKEHAKKAAWWKAHARLSSPSGMPCDTLCEIIKNE